MNDHDENLLMQLSEKWQQTDNKKPDLKSLKRRLMINRLKMFGLSLSDVLITAIMLYLFYKGYQENYSLSLMSWIGFGLIFGLVTTTIGTIQRLNAWSITDMDTKSWIAYEYNHTKSQLSYAKLLKYGVLTFGVFFHIWLLTGFLFDVNFPMGMNLRSLFAYLFSIGWFSLFWWLAIRIKRKALISIAYLDKEKKDFDELY